MPTSNFRKREVENKIQVYECIKVFIIFINHDYFQNQHRYNCKFVALNDPKLSPFSPLIMGYHKDIFPSSAGKPR